MDQTENVIVSIGDTGRAGKVGVVIAVLFLLGGIATATGGAPVVVTVVLLGLGGLISAFSVKNVRTSSRMDPGVLHVPTTVFLLSSRVPATFRRAVKKGSRDVQSVTARLVVQEFVSYQVGTDTQTTTKDVLELAVPVRPRPDPFGVAAEVDLAFPDYPPTFDASNNKVRWYLVVDLTMGDDFTDDSRFELVVAPAMLRAGGEG